jgi:penicillin-binding protein A
MAVAGAANALMGRRIRWLGVIMVVCLGLVIVQLVNIQLVKGKALQTSSNNPRIAATRSSNARGEILAADGTVLATSVPTPAGTSRIDYPYDYVRQYPGGSLFAGITGFDSALNFGTAGIEQQYDAYLSAHQEAPQTLSQLLFREKLPQTTDNVTLSIEPQLQQQVWNYLTTLPPGANNDGAVVVMQPGTGNILAMVSNPTYDPNALVGTSLAAEKLAYFSYNQKDHEGFTPLRPIATGETFAPGSTMKVVTSTAAYNLKPALAAFNYPMAKCQTFSDSNLQLCDQSGACGGTMTQMLPFSCDPGYGELGIQEGVDVLTKQAELFGYNAIPPIDLPSKNTLGGVVASPFDPLQPNAQALLAYDAIGQFGVQATALQNAMVAAGIANGGQLMTPHLMTSIQNSQGDSVTTYKPKAMSTVSSAQTAQQVTSLMQGVVATGTAKGVGFPSWLCAAVKTGTAQTTKANPQTEDWMIGFAPANHPQVAVAVVVPKQDVTSDGASVAGPIMLHTLEAAVPQASVSQPCNVAPVPVTAFTAGT